MRQAPQRTVPAFKWGSQFCKGGKSGQEKDVQYYRESEYYTEQQQMQKHWVYSIMFNPGKHPQRVGSNEVKLQMCRCEGNTY